MEEEKEDPELMPTVGIEVTFRKFSDVASPCSTSASSDELLFGSFLFGRAEMLADNTTD